MDNSVMGSGFLSGPTAGVLELDPLLHRHQQNHIVHPPLSHHHHVQTMNSMAGIESDHSVVLMGAKGGAPKAISLNSGKGKGTNTSIITRANKNNSNTSEDDEPSFMEDGDDAQLNGVKGKKGSPWQRMKWTDSMVRLLITVVACVGDDGTTDGAEGLKRKPGILQKKGKWKTVSKIMISKGCHVSPQQCEDKFNDLNKRYKRLNEILGKGTTCRVVENPILLDSMTHISSKMKDDVRKILSSKHLFYKEMCAYHNGQRIPNCYDLDIQGYSFPITRCSKDGSSFEEEEEDDNEDCDDVDLDNEDGNNADDVAERMEECGKRKKVNVDDDSFWYQSGGPESFGAEMAGILQDPTKSPWELKEWIKNRMLQLQEQRVSFQAQAFELEKRRFKWQRFCAKKDRELERLRLDNERMKLENERMALQVKQKELEIDFRRSEVPFNPVSLSMDRHPVRDQVELGRVQ